MKDYYEILQVHPKADAKVIEKAYKTLMLDLKKHPDRGGSVEEAQLINEAYSVLSDPQRRRDYDRKYGDWMRGGIIIICPNCGKKNRLPHGVEIDNARCGRCGGPFRIPTPAEFASRSERVSHKRKLEGEIMEMIRTKNILIDRWMRRAALAKLRGDDGLALEAKEKVKEYIKERDKLMVELRVLSEMGKS
ncbi:MAG: DnaJ domain-containing protein [bacterium]